MTDNSKNERGQSFYINLLIMILTGALNTIFVKLQNSNYYLIKGATFNHPWFQTINMFFGELYCSILWIFLKNKMIKEEEQELEAQGKVEDREDAPAWVFLVSCSGDVIGTTLLNFALISMASSVFQMLRGGIIVITCAFAILFLKKYPKNYEWLGVAVVFIGIFLVGLASQISSGGGQTTEIYAIIMLIFSLIFSGAQNIIQEKILDKYKTKPLQLVSWEGFWGFAIFLVLLPIFQFIPCNFEGMGDICSNDGEGNYTLENTIMAFIQMGAKVPLLLFTIGQTFSIAFFNYSGIVLVKYANASTRAVMDNTRTIIVWLFFLFYATYNSKGELVTEEFLWLQLVGFLILLIGQLIYNGLIKIPVLGFDYHFKNNEISDSDQENNNAAGLLHTKESSVKSAN